MKKSRLRLTLAVLILIGLAGIYYTKHSTSSVRTANLPHFGIAAGSSLPGMSGTELEEYFSGLQKLGVGWVRFDFDWNQIQPDNASSYDWDKYDEIISIARSHDLEILGIIDFTPEWARIASCDDSKQCAPASPDSYATFAKKLAERYKDQGLHYWEVWNEPNSKQFWAPAPDPAAYTRLLEAAYRSLHQADSQALVITGGTTPSATSDRQYAPAEFLTQIYKYGGKGSFDAVGAHPYTFPVPPSYESDHAWAQMSRGDDSMRGVMARHGDSAKKIWLSEFGAPTGGPGSSAEVKDFHLDKQPWHVSEALQAQILTDAVTLAGTYDWAGPLFIYSYQDAGSSDDTNENFFGLVRTDGSQKPAYTAFANAISTLPK